MDLPSRQSCGNSDGHIRSPAGEIIALRTCNSISHDKHRRLVGKLHGYRQCRVCRVGSVEFRHLDDSNLVVKSATFAINHSILETFYLHCLVSVFGTPFSSVGRFHFFPSFAPSSLVSTLLTCLPIYANLIRCCIPFKFDDYSNNPNLPSACTPQSPYSFHFPASTHAPFPRWFCPLASSYCLSRTLRRVCFYDILLYVEDRISFSAFPPWKSA